MIVKCPFCNSVVMRNPDGSCPTCDQFIEVDRAGQPKAVDDQYQRPRTVAAELLPRVEMDQADVSYQPEPSDHDTAIARFHHDLFFATPRLIATPAIVLINAIIFVAMTFSSGEIMNPDGLTLIEWGSNFGPKTLNGEAWRLFTSTFVHIGILHVAFNMWVLWSVGNLVERLVGNVGFVSAYVISGISGSLASVYWNPSVNSAGASGAVFGIFGALLGFMLLRSDSVPPTILKNVRSSGFSFLVINAVFGISVPGIDMAAHVGGLAAGFICGMILSQPLDRITFTNRSVRNVIMTGLGVAGITAALFAAPQPPIDARAMRRNFMEFKQRIEKKHQDAEVRRKNGRITDEQFVSVLRDEVLPEWQIARQPFDELNDVPRRQKPFFDLMKNYLDVKEKSWTLLAEAIEQRDESKLEEISKLNEQAKSLIRRIENTRL